MKNRKKRRGFTLVELVVSISILSVLTVTVIFGSNELLKRARDHKRLADIEQIKGALELFYKDHGRYPQDCGRHDGQWGNELSTRTNGFMNYLEPYLDTVPVDPINRVPTPYYDVDMTADDYFYSYNYYDGSQQGEYAGCEWPGPYGVLAIRQLEAGPPQGYTPDLRCTRPNPPNPITFEQEYDYYIFLTDNRSLEAQTGVYGLNSNAPPCTE